ncbi:CoA transferase [Aquihabitans sp. G128]|uniref:CoA transferase n=1 Tax=Aquihabitans sp. G128 TaxID=2849779 RepID=UPI001C225F8F|nr:CoA transferase [Aquihabitans sp. G128]QXC62875.1 CoA transferase [Aquihabitans sp. G128]
MAVTPPPTASRPMLGTEAHLAVLWAALGGEAALAEAVATSGPEVVLPSVFDVTGFASAAAGAAALAVAELWAARTGSALPAVSVDRTAACASFLCEALFEPQGWERPPIWDPLAGDHRSADGWIRLHTNYASHRDAALGALGLDPAVEVTREEVAARVALRSGDELEAAVVDEGGCAAVLRDAASWGAHPAGLATASEAPVRLGDPVPITGGTAVDLGTPPGAAPLAGIRVLDLTRVIAGPVATRYLAGYGADVVRIDPPGFAEVGALLPETTLGKRCAALDLRVLDDRRRFEALVAEAHVVVAGLRPGALAGLGYDSVGLRSLNPALVTVSHDAYGWGGPWSGRRGFDSLVQMSTGIAAAGMVAAGSDRPVPLPAQALDHGVGHLLAAATCRALTRLVRTGATAEVRGSLVGAANHLLASPVPGGLAAERGPWPDDLLVPVATAWGAADRVPLAGTIAGLVPSFAVPAGPLGVAAPTW